jgi:hypothetical protein
MQRFNEGQPTLTSLYSQQFAGSIKRLSDSYVSLFTYPIIKRFDGANDGLVTLASAVFDNYRGEITTKEGRGIAHASLVDILRKPFGAGKRREVSPVTSLDELLGVANTNETASSKDTTGAQFQVEDILDFHIALVADLKARGY